MRLFGYFYGKSGSKSLKALPYKHFIQNITIILYNPCPATVLLQSILNHHKRDARATNAYMYKYSIGVIITTNNISCPYFEIISRAT